MPDDRDHYEAYYADKLWKLLPAIYRTLDTDAFDKDGPLREIVKRIGAQGAILRRSMDRMWEDQSIETCDNWVISYIADLLATNLVAGLDARGQRVDVAKTIYYRRRKGTVAILEEIAADITGWDARVVEFFRRLGRTRHNFDPEIGLPSATDDPYGNYKLQRAEGLVGASTHTGIGGWADLRNSYGASKANSAFDEFFHTADFRRGRGQVGWYNIPRLGVFLWRLRSFGIGQTTPVEVKGCPGYYTFDPTGREIPLFAAAARNFGDQWVSPAEWQLPTAISTPLLRADLELPVTPLDDQHPDQQHLYAAPDPTDNTKVLYKSLGVFVQGNLIPGDQITADPQVTSSETFIDPQTGQPVTRSIAFFIDPEKGRLVKRANAPEGEVLVTYHYGFSSTIGAGPYDRRILGEKLADRPAPVQPPVSGGKDQLQTPLAALAPTGTVIVNDELTYNVVSNVGDATNGIQQVTIMAQNERCPLIRLPAPDPDKPGATEWVFTGADGSKLALEGLFVSGGDIVLRSVPPANNKVAQFASVTLTCCTLDPGNAGDITDPPTIYNKAVDGRDLVPCRLWVEAEVRELKIDRCITGPIRTRAGGKIEKLTITDSIVQAIRTDDASLFKDSAIALDSGEVNLTRCTILGPAYLHRLTASECILDDVVLVEDMQHGCVRFSAWVTGSVLPRRYESVRIAAKSPLFTTRIFGQPGYAQLLSNVDTTILPDPTPPAGTTIAEGAQDGSEMGAFARQKNPIKERSLRIKYAEFMPLGLVPVIIYVT